MPLVDYIIKKVKEGANIAVRPFFPIVYLFVLRHLFAQSSTSALRQVLVKLTPSTSPRQTEKRLNPRTLIAFSQSQFFSASANPCSVTFSAGGFGLSKTGPAAILLVAGVFPSSSFTVTLWARENEEHRRKAMIKPRQNRLSMCPPLHIMSGFVIDYCCYVRTEYSSDQLHRRMYCSRIPAHLALEN
jgi:hypothetical protein